MRIELRNRFTGDPVFTCDDGEHEDVASVLTHLRDTGVPTHGLDLRNSNFERCDFKGCQFRRCDFTGSTFTGCRLNGSTFYESDLADAVFKNCELAGVSFKKAHLLNCNFRSDITDARFGGAVTEGMIFRGHKLVGVRGIVQIYPIGSRNDKLTALNTESGIVLQTGCFTGTLERFHNKLEHSHGLKSPFFNRKEEFRFYMEYKNAIAMIQQHFKPVTMW